MTTNANSVTAALATLGGSGWTVNAPTPYVGGNQAAAYTWAGKPAANAVPVGTVIRITDFGVPFVLMISDGTIWAPVGPQVAARSAVAVSVTGTTNETALATVTIPGGAMGLNGGLDIRSTWTFTGSVNNKTLRARLGGIGGTQFLTTVQTTNVSMGDARRIRNRNSASSQACSFAASAGGVGAAGGAIVTAAIDTSAAVDLVFTGQLALGTETATLESYEVWLLP